MSTAFSPIMMEGALVLPLTTSGMIDASATRRPADLVAEAAKYPLLAMSGNDVR